MLSFIFFIQSVLLGLTVIAGMTTVGCHRHQLVLTPLAFLQLLLLSAVGIVLFVLGPG